MTHPNAAKGKRWERAVVELLRAHGHPVERRALAGTEDRGDIIGLSWVLECKDVARVGPGLLAEWADKATAAAARAGVGRWAILWKRRGAPPERAFVVLELAEFLNLLERD